MSLSTRNRFLLASALILTAALATTSGFLLAQNRPSAANLPDPKVLSYTLPENIPWIKGEASDRATLQGDPSKPGIYIELVKWHPGNMSRPHSHSGARYITVLEGTWWLGWGPTYDPDSTFPAKAGSYVVHHANQLHYDGAKDEDALILIVGEGPSTTQR